MRRLVTLVYVNTKLSEEGVKNFYINVLSKTPHVKKLDYVTNRGPDIKIKHVTITDTVTKRVKAFLINKTKFNDFSDTGQEDTPTPVFIKTNEYLRFNITIYAIKKRMIEDAR